MAVLQSEPFEITLTGKYYSLLLPEHIVQPFLEKNERRVKVKASFKGKEIEFHAAIQKRNGNYVMMFGKKHQKTLGIFLNDYFQMQFFEDTSKYGVETSEEFEAVMTSDPVASELFETLTDGRKRGLIYAIDRYKNSQTRIDKYLNLCENLKKGIRDPQELLKSF
ncbi:YdeI/OmpD-associated family protein [Maribacter sp. 2210JD10-5]|uniref:YdeI/OmpD-associated family protein n=1 Tax=Maribacter sp. 2210JD10-5 TaxID=3386272 RepID=UPI0039BD608A